MKSIILYSTPTCPYCQKTKDWFSKHNVQFSEVNVAEDEKAADEIIEETGQAGVPVWKVVENGNVKRIVIGFDIDALEEEFGN